LKHGLRVLAIVPARGGTDRVPYLNIKRLGDRALLAHTLEAARGAKTVDRVVVSTDDAAVADVARAHGAEAPFLRPEELAGDIPSLKPVIAHAVREMEALGERADVVVVLQATSPFREAAAIDEAVERLVSGGFDAVVSVTEDRTLGWRAEGERLVPLFEKEGRRDEQRPVFKENGAVVALRRAIWFRRRRRPVGYLVLESRRLLVTPRGLRMAERCKPARICSGRQQRGDRHGPRPAIVTPSGRLAGDVAFLCRTTAGVITVSRHTPPSAWPDAPIGPPWSVVSPRPSSSTTHRCWTPVREGLSREATGEPGGHLDDLERTEHYAPVIVSVMGEDREAPRAAGGKSTQPARQAQGAGRRASCSELAAIPGLT
jgi:CMP-N-acetylneuraminic acid synthetase